MTRIEFCKKELEKVKFKSEDLHLKFQELNNLLPTYKEKKELSEIFRKVESK